MANLPSFSIVTATLNNAAGLASACASLSGQAYPRMQHIIVDAMSRDETPRIIDQYRSGAGYPVEVVREPDTGMYEGVNKGIRRASGEIIGILNSGDRYPPGALQAVARSFASSGADVVAGSIRCIKADGRPGEIWVPDVTALSQRMSVPHPAVFVRRQVYDRVGLFDERYRIAADYDLMLRIQAAGVGVHAVDSVFCEFQEGGMSETRLWQTARETFSIQRAHVGAMRPGLRYAHRVFELSVIRPAALFVRRWRGAAR